MKKKLAVAYILAALAVAVVSGLPVWDGGADNPNNLENDFVVMDGNPTGYEIWKGARTSPVTMYYDPINESWAVPDSLIETAITEWNAVTPNFKFVYGGRLPAGSQLGQENTCTSSPPNGLNTISWWQMTGGTLARACIWSTSEECDIQIGFDIPVLLQPEAFRTVLTHEAGHCAGLAHSDVREAVMWPSYFAPKHIAADDEAGICFLYGGCSGTFPTPTPTATFTSTPTRTATATPTRTPTPTPPRYKVWAPFLAKG